MQYLGYKKNPDLVEIGKFNTNLIISSNLDLNLYDDISSIENWVLYEPELGKDTLYIRERIRDLLNIKGWNNCNNNEKDIIIKYYLKESVKSENDANTEKVMHLMGKGLTLLQAQGFLIQSFSDFHLKEINSCALRANSALLYTVIGKYLSIEDASDLIKVTYKLFYLYKTQAIRGTFYGTAGEGLLDFIASTPGTQYEFTGLEQQGYTLLAGTYLDFITDLLDILQHGNY